MPSLALSMLKNLIAYFTSAHSMALLNYTSHIGVYNLRNQLLVVVFKWHQPEKFESFLGIGTNDLTILVEGNGGR